MRDLVWGGIEPAGAVAGAVGEVVEVVGVVDGVVGAGVVVVSVRGRLSRWWESSATFVVAQPAAGILVASSGVCRNAAIAQR